MKLSLQPTAEIVTVDGVPMRIWRGTTDAGTEVHAYIRVISVPIGASAQEHERFARELTEIGAPRFGAIPLRFLD